jgi:hypothetical protein
MCEFLEVQCYGVSVCLQFPISDRLAYLNFRIPFRSAAVVPVPTSTLITARTLVVAVAGVGGGVVGVVGGVVAVVGGVVVVVGAVVVVVVGAAWID